MIFQSIQMLQIFYTFIAMPCIVSMSWGWFPLDLRKRGYLQNGSLRRDGRYGFQV